MPFGVLAEIDPVDVARADTVRKIGKFAGMLASAFANHRRDDGEDAGDDASPCPDAKAGQKQTPCEKNKENLLAQAKAKREERMQARGLGA